MGFTELSSKCTAEELIITLNELFANFDKLGTVSEAISIYYLRTFENSKYWKVFKDEADRGKKYIESLIKPKFCHFAQCTDPSKPFHSTWGLRQMIWNNMNVERKDSNLEEENIG